MVTIGVETDVAVKIKQKPVPPPVEGRRSRKGALNQSTIQKMDRLSRELATGKMPLDVMLEHMRFAQDKAHELTKSFITRVDAAIPKDDPKALAACLEQIVNMFGELRAWRTLALDAATRAAPYCHPKLNAIAMKINDPEGTRSIVDVNLIAASHVAVSEVIEHEIAARAHGTPPDEYGTIPGEPSNTAVNGDDERSTANDSAESRTESGET
jgi:hypothetical protein